MYAYDRLTAIVQGQLPTMNPWIPYPPWQNFSSMFREAITAQEARTGMEKSHHLTASLYFGIAALRALQSLGD